MSGNGNALAEPRLGFKPHLRVEVVPGDAVYLFSETRVTALRGDRVMTLAPLLDGTRGATRVLEDAGDTPDGQSGRILARLSEAGLLCERDGAADPASLAQQAYWELAGMNGAQAATRVAASTVQAFAVGTSGLGLLRDALTCAGLRLAGAGRPGGADLAVVLCDDYLNPELALVDAAQRAAGRPWMPVKACGTGFWIGPVFRPGDGACLACLADKLWRNRPVDAHVQHVLERPGPVSRPPSVLPSAGAVAAHLAAVEAAKWLAGHRDPGQRMLRILDSLTLGSSRHPVPRRPQCPGCGDPAMVARRVRQPVVLSGRPKADTTGGGHRALTPQQVMDRYGHLVDPVTGLVREIRRDSRGPEFLNCFHAGHNPVAGPHSSGALRVGLRSTSSGKGITGLHARVSALCEALERHSGHLQGDEPRVRARYRDLGPEAAVHPDSVQLFAERQFAGRQRWNAEHGPVHQVCDPFDETDETDWTPAWSLTAGRHRLVPTSLLYYNVPQAAGRRYCWANSNGAAAGGSPEDAVLHGLLELVERDAVALWWYNRTRQPGVDLEAFADPWNTELRDVYARLRREVWALDLTSDLGIPVVAAVSRRTDGPLEDIVLGFGAHFDRRVALRRALTELNQMLPPVADVSTSGTGYGCTDPDVLRWWRTATAENQPYLLPDPERPSVSPERGTAVPGGDLRDDLRTAEDIVRRAGLEMLVLDQTRPDVGLPVMKVLVPGLRPHWARFAPGRLFDVPVRLGRLATPTAYEALNPIPLFL
jgi:ribosomal protein S12 methylthiotransferase accessory factor